MMLFQGCSIENSSSTQKLSKQYSIGDEIDLGGVKFNIYKIDDTANELYLLAQQNIATTPFSESERSYEYLHDYEGSLVEGHVNRFVDELEDKGYIINSSGIIDKDDLIDLGFEIAGLNGTKYEISNAPEFIEYEPSYWVDGYCKYDSYAWVYNNGILTTQKCESNSGVRVVIVIKESEISKQP